VKLIFIRHGSTSGNLEHRYVGRTDELLCPEGIMALKKRSYPDCDRLLVSPLQRCIQTAEILFPEKEMQIVPDFRECNFGDFEGKNYQELHQNPLYQKWIDSGGRMPFPNGEYPQKFRERCVKAFLETLPDSGRISYIVHGGTIMAILAEFAGGNYYDYQIPNGAGYLAEWSEHKIKILEEL